MEKKGTIISLIFVAIVVVATASYIIVGGITAKDYNYVQLEINPRVEFICDKHFKVVSLNPLNDDARIVLANTDYIGKDIESVATDFIEQCALTGFIDVNGNDNAVNITVIDGLTQALDVHVTQSIYEYLKANEIMCAVVENYEDRHMSDEKKEHNVCCANKYKLISTLNNQYPEMKIEKLKKLSEVKLIKMISNMHNDKPYIPTEEYKNLKSELIESNKVKYNTHLNAISNLTQQEFSEIFDDYQKTIAENYKINFEENYNNWQNNCIS